MTAVRAVPACTPSTTRDEPRQLRRHRPGATAAPSSSSTCASRRSAASSAAGSRTRPTSTSGRRRSTRTPASSTASCPRNPGQASSTSQAVADLAHSHGLPLIVDSTVATPALLRPLAPRRRHRRAVGRPRPLTSRGFGIAGAVIARKDLDQHVARRRAEGRLRALREVPAQPRHTARTCHPMQADPRRSTTCARCARRWT
ncbi:MAG: hypothetical protein M0C28_40980 [Candidatus Moduliflexus flocculans]|nr:hypothetical protein [Candidatus Moduliflexus flocculans]